MFDSLKNLIPKRLRLDFQLSIRHRLALGFGVVMALLVAQVALSATQFNRTSAQLNRMVGDDAKQAELVRMMQMQIGEAFTGALSAVVLTDPDDVKFQRDIVTRNLAAFDGTEQELMKRLAAGDDKAINDQMEVVRQDADLARRPLSQLLDQLGVAEERERVSSSFANGVKPMFDTLLASSGKLGDMQRAASQVSADTALKQVRASLVGLVTFAALALVVAVLAAWSISRSIAAPIFEAVRMAERVAAGDLTEQPTRRWPSELTQLSDALKRMQQSLRSLVADVSTSARGIALASGEIASGNLDLSTRTETAAGQLQQAASALEQVNGALAHTTEAAGQASEMAGLAAGAARDGQVAVASAVAKMEEINASSRQIEEITSVIDAIAFQTNILALNAAVEAARAGEQGRGFAVVASEVRTLAQRSSKAAGEIRDVIQESVAQVKAGRDVVNATGQAMRAILVRVEDVVRVVDEIRVESRARATDVRGISSAVAELDLMTQRNAALVEQSAAAADGMQGQTQSLLNAVSSFRLDEDEVPADSV